jgi:hypothetical protein
MVFLKCSLSLAMENAFQPHVIRKAANPPPQGETPMNKTLIALLAAASVFAFGAAQASDAKAPAAAAEAKAAPAAEAKPAKKAHKKAAKKAEEKKADAAAPAAAPAK